MFYFWEMTKANLRVAGDILRPHPRIRPQFLQVQLPALSDVELLLFANLITMTPGSITVDMSEDRNALEAHLLYLDDEVAARNELALLLDRILRLTRGSGGGAR